MTVVVWLGHSLALKERDGFTSDALGLTHEIECLHLFVTTLQQGRPIGGWERSALDISIQDSRRLQHPTRFDDLLPNQGTFGGDEEFLGPIELQ